MEKTETSATQTPQGSDAINKSINALLENAFPDLQLHKAIDGVKDSKTTADAVLASVPSSQNDKTRNAGRPKEISDVPSKDEDGKRAGQYDGDVTENENKEEENDEAKKQSASIDQTSEGRGRIKQNPKAPAMRPFLKKGGDSESTDDFQKSFAKFEEFQAFQAEELKKSAPEMVEISLHELDALKKAAEMQALPAEKVEDSVSAPADPEALVKSLIASETEGLRKSVETLTQTNAEQSAMLKSMGNTPKPTKAVTSVESLEKSTSPEVAGAEAYTHKEVGDAAFELVKSGKLDEKIVYEFDMTRAISDPEARKMVEDYLAAH